MATALQPETQMDPPFVWQSPDQTVSIRLDLDLVDRLGAEVIRGYGLVPKRGAEVGGILLGKLRSSLPLVIEVLDFVPAECEYERGPSFLLSERDHEAFKAAVAEQRSAGELEVVGFYRSHTRDGCKITAEDVALFDELFRGPEQVFLLVKPSATRVPQAGFLYRERGKLEQTEPVALFPFRRKEMTGGAGERPAQDEDSRRRNRHEHRRLEAPPSLPAPRPLEEARPIEAPRPVETPPENRPAKRPSLLNDDSFRPLAAPPPSPPKAPPRDWESPAEAAFQEELRREGLGLPQSSSPARQQARDATVAALEKTYASRERRRRWRGWLIVAIACSIVGLLLGREWAWRLMQASPAQAYYDLHLAATPRDRTMVITWQGSSPAIAHAVKGMLTISDGGKPVTVELSREELGEGKLIYRDVTSAMQFRLEISESAGGNVSQTVDWKQ